MGDKSTQGRDEGIDVGDDGGEDEWNGGMTRDGPRQSSPPVSMTTMSVLMSLLAERCDCLIRVR